MRTTKRYYCYCCCRIVYATTTTRDTILGGHITDRPVRLPWERADSLAITAQQPFADGPRIRGVLKYAYRVAPAAWEPATCRIIVYENTTRAPFTVTPFRTYRRTRYNNIIRVIIVRRVLYNVRI